ncbi:MAG: glutamine-hydrolyzing carbamoyl-phosphate synthase small subunit [Dissulfurimicrobium sp.]|uniref:glutamine-hydrolyzing carbamoyl-phosphate synthase small subunit n=1 Tax=Dissulfurimicrobium TaxID=1769732 RepID=UPI003C7966B2
MKALIALEDGRIFEGRSFTGHGEVYGEMVFNTSMTGYQEILTDPSYKGQIVTMTYPLIGNYGTNNRDIESCDIHAEALVVREYEEAYSNWRADMSLRRYLMVHNKLGIEQVDTRALTRHIRLKGAMKAAISTKDLDPGSLTAKARSSPGLVGRDLVKEVTCRTPYIWKDDKITTLNAHTLQNICKTKSRDLRVAVLDCGLKYNQLRLLEKRGCECVVFPCTASKDELLSVEPDGVFLSNGPGDPAALCGIVETVKGIIGRRPIFGICLGHQILGLAVGGRTFKLKFGHRGANQPVKDLETGKIEITSQNHGFSVDDKSLPPEIEITHINLNDHTVEGMRHKKFPMFSVQYHPENAPGPHDAEYLFDRFTEMMRQCQRERT